MPFSKAIDGDNPFFPSRRYQLGRLILAVVILQELNVNCSFGTYYTVYTVISTKLTEPI